LGGALSAQGAAEQAKSGGPAPSVRGRSVGGRAGTSAKQIAKSKARQRFQRDRRG
jgi:hypothetical protein